jgi:hypothetical protein
MIIYLASGFTVSNVKGREKKLYYKYRLMSYYFLRVSKDPLLLEKYTSSGKVKGEERKNES